MGFSYIMIIAITYTILPKVEITDEDLYKWAENFIAFLPEYYNRKEKGLKDISYNIVCLSYGLHCNASRHHIHIGHLIETNNEKIIKNWDKSLRPLFAKHLETSKEKIDFKISFNAHVEDKDKMAVLGYPLKEYNHYNEILRPEKFINLLPKEIEELRVYAHEIYRLAQIAKAHKKEQKDKNENTIDDKYNYLDKRIQNESLSFSSKYAEDKIRTVIIYLLDHQKEQYDNNNIKIFRIQSIKDLAISYCFNKRHITENDVAQLIKI